MSFIDFFVLPRISLTFGIVKKIGIVGSGNVATHLVAALQNKGIIIAGLYSRNSTSGKAISARFQIPLFETMEAFNAVDVIIACVSDDAIPVLIPELAKYAPTVTTSGTVDVLAFQHTHPIGVFYPLQTFTKDRAVTFDQLPIFIEASTPTFADALQTLALKLSSEVHLLAADKRKELHLAAVLVNNFTNHLMTLAKNQLEANHLPFSWLQPLLKETVSKIETIPPFDAQTGPARRNDQQTIDAHIALIKNDQLKQLYIQFSKSIQTTYNHD